MNSQPVMIKSSKNGINLILDDKLPFSELLDEIKKKFIDSEKFFKDAKIAISFEGRSLSENEQFEILDVIQQNTSVTIICVIDHDELIDEVFYNEYVVAGALIIYGILFIIVENWNKGKRPIIGSVAEIGYDTALIIGIFQLLAAVVPGTSRSGATIIGALLLGVSRGAAAEFTFYLAIPVMFGASLLKIVKSGLGFGAMGYVTLLMGMAVAFFVSLFVIRYLMSYIRKHDFKAFGYYRIILGIVVLLFFFFVW